MRQLFSRSAGLATIVVMVALGAMSAALAQPPEDETKVRAVVADWYRRIGNWHAEQPWVLFAAGGFDAGPGYSVPADLNSGAAVIRGPYLNYELAARALKFTYDIDDLKTDASFAKVIVWEHGYFYASAAQQTYENAASTLFLLEKQADGEWKILLHNATSQGIPPNKITKPMPDLRALYYERCGNVCDPVADAKNAADW